TRGPLRPRHVPRECRRRGEIPAAARIGRVPAAVPYGRASVFAARGDGCRLRARHHAACSDPRCHTGPRARPARPGEGPARDRESRCRSRRRSPRTVAKGERLTAAGARALYAQAARRRFPQALRGLSRLSATLAWKLNRLRAMGPAEVCWRVRRGFAAGLERRGFGLAREVDAGGAAGLPWVRALPTKFDASLYTAAAEELIAGRWNVLSLRAHPLGFPPCWNRDPKTGLDARVDFGKAIDYRNVRVAGDVKYLWELNRHLELVTLAQAWHLSREPRFALAADSLLSSWLAQCPYPRGLQWASPLESAVRLVNWACAWTLLGGERSPLFDCGEGRALRRRWLAAIYRHCHFISRNLSRYSSANNHLFGELTGLFVASLTWPLWEESTRWREAARRELEAEALRQNGPDGSNREQAFWYHHEVADMMLLCLLFGRANGVVVSPRFAERLEAMLGFIAAVMDSGGNVPQVGDSDDAVIVRFSPEPEFCPYRSLLATGAVLFDRADFKAKARRVDDKSRWLLGDAASAKFTTLTAARPAKTAFPDGGDYILGRDSGAASEVKCVVHAGAPGR